MTDPQSREESTESPLPDSIPASMEAPAKPEDGAENGGRQEPAVDNPPPAKSIAGESIGSESGGDSVADAPPRRRKRPIYRDYDLLQLAAIVFLIDQLTKFLVRAYLPFGYSYPTTGFFRFTHAENTGSAFGILQGQNTPLIVVSFVGIFVLAMIYHSQPRATALLRLSLALQIGGAVGNLVDRLRLGAVTDFIDVGAWPIFNLADASIVSGLVLLGWIFLRPGGRNEDAESMPATVAHDYGLKRRGRCARCGRYHAGRRSRCAVSITLRNAGGPWRRRAVRR